MHPAVEQLARSVRRRSTSAMGKRRACQLQYVSAVVFALVAAALCEGSTLLFLLFALEACGQSVLATDTHHSGKRGDDEVVYFRRNALGMGAVVIFALVSCVRFAIADSVLAFEGVALMAGASACAASACLVLLGRARADLVMGATIGLSAVSLGGSLAIAGYPEAACAQFAYATLLAIGVFALSPWQAELVNIPIFASAALWPGPL